MLNLQNQLMKTDKIIKIGDIFEWFPSFDPIKNSGDRDEDPF